MKTTDDLPSVLKEIVLAAIEVRNRAYAHYSKFPVGAAVRVKMGAIFAGCNIKNVVYPVGLCAERVAISVAVAAGERSLVQLAIIGDLPEPLTTSGICRQVLSELAPDIVLVMSNLSGQVRLSSIGELLPLPFRLRFDIQAQENA